ncbi:MAG: ATP--cob(I)alamin adenosyltransferase [Eubacteriales bacterium]|nr:ATP--cob(I)alamin adenosyltransferase [Eubacteriales bacterium]
MEKTKMYRSPYEAYPFLADAAGDLRCDFELLTDELASLTGLLAAKVEEESLRRELLWIDELIYHANPTLRTHFSVTVEELRRLKERTCELREQAAGEVHRFVLPCGCEAASLAHVLRVKAKMLVRLIYRHMEQGGHAEEGLLDFCNLLSGYFFGVALLLNRISKTPERDFVSRNY